MAQCSYNGCQFECYENHDKCIFHYDKADWLTPKTKVWKSSAKEKIEYFWQELRARRSQVNGNYTGFVFPKFEDFYHDEISSDSNGRHGINDYSKIDNIYFGYRNRLSYNWYYAYLPRGTSFENATFMDMADFSKIFFDVNHYGGISFKNAQFKKEILFSHTNLAYIDFSEAEFNEEFIFDNHRFSSCDFGGVKFLRQVSFKNTYFSHTNFLKATLKGAANFENGSFGSDVDFSEGKFDNDAIFTQREFNGNADFNKMNIRGEVDFENCIFRKNIYFNKIKSKKLNFISCNFLEKDSEEENYDLVFDSGNYGEVNLRNSTISKDFTSRKSQFKKLIFIKTIIERWSEVEFRNIEIDTLIFDKYVNESEKVLFDFVTVNKNLKIKHVSFDQERFNHFDMSKATVEIENSAFNTNFFNSVKWGTITEKRYKASRDIFRQLKFYSEQQKNFIDADGFYSLEMKEQKKELVKERKELPVFQRISHFISNSFVYYLHEKTSNFSQSWIMPLYWLVLMGMIGVIYKNHQVTIYNSILPYIFAYIVGSIILFYGCKNIFNLEKIPKELLYVFIAIPIVYVYCHVSHDCFDDIAKLLNPANIFKQENLTKNKEFLSLMFKVVVLFLVYQIITAIKKKVRSK